GLAVARRTEVLRLRGGVRRHPESRQHREAVTAFKTRVVALSVEIRRELTAQRAAVGGEPMIGEGERAGEIGRSHMGDAIDAGLHGVAAAAAEAACQTPIRAAARKREADERTRRDVIIHTGREAE